MPKTRVTKLRKEDILGRWSKELSASRRQRAKVDDIDNLGNPFGCVRVGELLENQYGVGLLRMERRSRSG